MFKKGLLLLLTFQLLNCFDIKAIDSSIIVNFENFSTSFEKGDLINAERFLLNILEVKDSLSTEYLVAVYNNLGVVNIRLGRYNEALIYINLAERTIVNKHKFEEELGDIYINKARVYGIIMEFDKAIDYLDQGLKIYHNFKSTNKKLYKKISTGYLNLGLTYYEINDFGKSLEYLNKSLNYKAKYSLSEKALVYLNIAKVYVKTKDFKKAERNFLWCIESFDKEFGPNYYRTTSVLFDYGLFLRSVGRNKEAYNVHQKALAVCLKNYGDKHSYVALAYKLLGDHYSNEFNFKTALEYYQKSLIAIVGDFNDTSIYINPSINSAIFNYRLLENLKSKSHALRMLSVQQKNQLKLMEKSYETINLALQLIEKIRSDNTSHESKLYLAENEKDTYLAALEITNELFSLTKNTIYIERMYMISNISKSSVLRTEINENEILYSKNAPDSILSQRNSLKLQISSYNKLIQDEYQKTKPDTQKVESWKDKLFELNRTNEILYDKIKIFSLQYQNLITKTEPINIQQLQDKINSDETIVEYFIPHNYNKGNRDLYIFTINKKSIKYHLVKLDSLFALNVDIIKRAAVNRDIGNSKESYKKYITALAYMYDNLIKPVKNDLAGKKLIIIPDEEISYLPFDAFITGLPQNSSVGFDGINYLIFNYSISYCNSSSFIFSNKRVRSKKVISFLPNYTKIQNNYEPKSNLTGAKREVNSIKNNFSDINYTDEFATEHNFKIQQDIPTIFHLAMHTSTDSLNSAYSYLIFNSKSDSIEDGKLYSYEISMKRMESPMVVLSACNTGTGNLYHGEGIMSLSRNFILAGASSVVNTLWDVNDEASAPIISDFYYFLSKGKEKDVAMQLAKIKYLKNATPTYANPYYWAAYQVNGDKKPIKSSRTFYYITASLIATTLIGFYCYYFRKRKKLLY